MDWLPALYMWLVVAVSGLAAAFFVGYFADARKAAMIGVAVAALMAVGAVIDAWTDDNWWIVVGALAGAGTAWWQLYRRDIRQSD